MSGSDDDPWGAGSAPAVGSGAWGPVSTDDTPPNPPPGHLLLGLLGRGGMGEVWAAFHQGLQRSLALKVLRRELADDPGLVQRFVAEAQATAQLTHPGIVPVHELGQLDDGRPWFTMKQVTGDTFTTLLATPGVTLRRRIDLFRRACEAVASAHAHGVAHRDLKPDNLMVGAFGEVLVLDWGLARLDGNTLRTIRGEASELDTRIGTVAGTPRYMAPEQAAGERGDARADVFSLGLVLWEILAGHPARDADPEVALLEAPTPPSAPAGAPEELAQLCDETLAPEPTRPTSAAHLADGLTAWLDGARRRERALEWVDASEEAAALEASLAERAAHAREAAAKIAGHVEPHAPFAAKVSSWRAEDEARALEAKAGAAGEDRVTRLEQALAHVPDLPEALDRLADVHQGRHALAEAAGTPAATEHLRQLRRVDRGRHAAWVQGDGTLSLATEPAGAMVQLHRYVLRDRRLVPEHVRELGRTPLDAVPLPMGSYLLTLHAKDHQTVRYPIHIRRCQQWDGVGPGGHPVPIPLPRLGELGRQDHYVPAGWFRSGMTPALAQCQPAADRWCDGWVFRRFPVSQTEYLGFLNDLLATGREAEALAWAPRYRSSRPDEAGARCYGRGEDGRFQLVPDADGDLWDPRWPAFLIDAPSADAYAAWEADRTGEAWQLPDELAWEKAARGVDGRVAPWGDHLDPAFAAVRASVPGRPMPHPVDAYPLDESPYGIRSMGGNVREWCAGRFSASTDERVMRGGCWFFTESGMRAAVRYALAGTNRGDTIGFRLARPFRRSEYSVGSGTADAKG